ncbi:unnamed protein product, partial [Brassica napus]
RTNEREGRENVHSDKNGRVCRRVVGVAGKKDNTFVYMCGLKGMEKGIDEIMISLAAKDGWGILNRDRLVGVQEAIKEE